MSPCRGRWAADGQMRVMCGLLEMSEGVLKRPAAQLCSGPHPPLCSQMHIGQTDALPLPLQGYSLLHFALTTCNEESTVELLLDSGVNPGANVNRPLTLFDPRSKSTMLHKAAKRGWPSVVRRLVAAGGCSLCAACFCPCCLGACTSPAGQCTPLPLRTSPLTPLVPTPYSGADMTLRDRDGLNPLHVAGEPEACALSCACAASADAEG